MNRNNFLIVIFFTLTIFSCRQPDSSLRPSLSDALASFELADGFQIEMIAAEPLISDPVAMEIDEYGKMYVVEMHGYPLDKSGSGTVKVLQDTDGDGVMDKSHIFADNLKFPTGILRWKQGFLVTDPPNLLYFEDTNQNGTADRRDTLLTGFAISNPQHNFNSPMLGIDNWIYVSNEPAGTAKVYTEEFSDLGAEVRYHNQTDSPVLPQNSGGRRIRLKPDALELEMMSSQSQYGQTYDKWGRHFLVSNANHIYHEVIQAPYLLRNPDLLIPAATQSISDHGSAAEVYPITVNPEHQLLTDLGVFTSSCGIISYQGGLFPAPYDYAFFVAEPVANIVHADLVQEKGASFNASRILENQEFLASRDSWFRPVNHYVGPDGALCVVDYYRRVIEHPEWMAEGAADASNLYDGIDQGRIYRITPKGTAKADWTGGTGLQKASDADLVGFLDNPNHWYRKNAQRLILERNARGVIDQLKAMVKADPSNHGKLHAAWTLEGLGVLERDQVITMLKDGEAGIRENGILLAEQFLQDPAVMKALYSLSEDPNDRVRFQLLCSLGETTSPEAGKIREEMLFSDGDDVWMQIAALSAKAPDYKKLLTTAIQKYDEGNPSSGDLVQRLTAMLAAKDNLSELQHSISMALSAQTKDEGWQTAMLKGLVQGSRNGDWGSADLEPERKLLLKAVFSKRKLALRKAALALMKKTDLPTGNEASEAIAASRKLINDKEADLDDRSMAIRFMVMAEPAIVEDLLNTLLVPSEVFDIQKTVFETLGSVEGAEVGQLLVKQWPSLTPNLREQAIAVLLKTEARIRMLVEALENGTIDHSAVSWPRQVGLMAQADEGLRQRSREIFADPVQHSDRKAVIEQYQAAIALEGDPILGKTVYQKNCAICHQIGEAHGVDYGPDLGSIRSRKKEAILLDILDPNMSIADGYDLWEVKLQNGETKQGIIGSETSGSLTLRIYGGADEVLSRQDIQSIQATGLSMMPTGLETQITKEEMADLLSFIKNPKQ